MDLKPKMIVEKDEDRQAKFQTALLAIMRELDGLGYCDQAKMVRMLMAYINLDLCKAIQRRNLAL